MVTFDGPNLLITLPSIGTFDVQNDLYSNWKEWVALSDNAKFPAAFDTTGGDVIGAGLTVAPYFFLRTDSGWRIKLPEEDGTVTITGNLYPRNDGEALESPPSGDFTVVFRLLLSSQAIAVGTGGGGVSDCPTATEIADAVWNKELP